MKIKAYVIKGEKYCKLEDVKELVKEVKRNVDIQGWQGKDKIEIVKIGTDWNVTEHRKDKDSGEVATNVHTIPEMNVIELWDIIKTRAKNVGEKTRYREVALDIINKKHIPVSIDEFNGGHNRSKYLFPLYYYPVKILESQGFIKYGGRGSMTRLK